MTSESLTASSRGVLESLRVRLTPLAARRLLVFYAVSIPVAVAWAVMATGLGWEEYTGDEAVLSPVLFAFMAVQVGTAASGGIIALRKPGHLVGWCLMLAGISFWFSWLLLIPFDLILLLDNQSLAGLAEGAFNGAATFWVTLVAAALFLFPNGQMVSPRWKSVAWVYWASLSVGFAASLVNGGWGGDQERVDYPSPLREPLAPLGDVLSAAFNLFLLLSLALGVVAVVVRFVRAKGTERQQLKILVFATVAMVAMISIQSFVASGAALDSDLQFVLASAVVLLIPISIMVAVMRYGLYEIDRIISRTVAYAIVVAALAAVFALGVLAIPTLLPTEGSSLAVAASTLAVAALFNPLRRRVQRGVDKIFNRSRYDHQQVADAFAARLRDEVDPAEVVAGWVGVVNETMQPASASIWVKKGAA